MNGGRGGDGEKEFSTGEETSVEKSWEISFTLLTKIITIFGQVHLLVRLLDESF